MKNINNQGFTLIELIATIALLAIIAAISFVSISKVIEQSKVNDCNSTFVNSVSNNKVNITANDLINNNYLTSPIINPYTKEEINPSNIKISIELNTNYTAKQVTITAPDFLKECK